jgi:hypothetical protein
MHSATVIRAAATAAFVAALAPFAQGQVETSCPVKSSLGGAGTIVGAVGDTSLVPLDSVNVYIVSTRLQTLSMNGIFRFDKLKPGQYELSARRLGYLPQTRTVTVGGDGGITAFCLVPAAQILAPVVTSAVRGGLSGVIADTAFGIVPGAEITVLGGSEHAISDSAGIFYVPAKPGHYMVHVKRAGFESKMVSVTVPRDSGRKILVWLMPASGHSVAREESNAYDLKLRLETRVFARSKIYTRQDINDFGATDVRQLAQAGASKYIDDGCFATIDGGPDSIPMWALKPEEIEMLEVYTLKNARNAPTSIIANNRRRLPAPGANCGVQVFAWLRK